MGTLAVTRSLVSQTNPTESQFDTMRTDLLNFFNAASMNEDNIATGGALYSSLGACLDDATLKFTSSHGTIAYISASDYLKVSNTQGDVSFGLMSGSTFTSYLTLRQTDGALEVAGIPTFNTATGSQTVDTMWLLSRYRKPRLVYQDNDIFTIESNITSDGATRVLGPTGLWRVIDRTCSLAVDANGETNTDVGAAVSGRAQGVARTPNRWYYAYAVEVQYGDDASGANCIIIAHTTSPESGNITTLNTAFGTGKWVYLGVVRNGYNDAGGGTDVIVPFVYDEAGYLRFTKGSDDNEGLGVTLDVASGSITNLEYDVTIGNGADDTIPAVATRVIFTGYRATHGFELHYREIASSENHFITSGCYHVSELAELTPLVNMEVPLLSGYRVVVVMGNVGSDKRICLAGLLDHYA